MLGMSTGTTPNIYGDPASDLANAGIVSIFGAPNATQLAAIVAASPASGSGSGPCPAPVCDVTEQTNLLLSLLDSIYTTVDRLFPVITIVAKDRTAATASTYLKPRAFARVYWAQQHTGIKFGGDPPNPETVQIHLLQLKDIYLMTGFDMTIEPLFLLLTPPAPAPAPASTEP